MPVPRAKLDVKPSLRARYLFRRLDFLMAARHTNAFSSGNENPVEISAVPTYHLDIQSRNSQLTRANFTLKRRQDYRPCITEPNYIRKHEKNPFSDIS